MLTTISDSDSGFEGQLNQCCTNLDDFVTTLNLDAAKVAKLKTTNAFVKFIFNLQLFVQAKAHHLLLMVRIVIFGIQVLQIAH